MTSRFRFRLTPTVGLPLILSLALPGCTDAMNAGVLEYVQSPKVAADLKDKPELQKAVRKELANLFGPAPNDIKVPKGSGFFEAGRRLGNLVVVNSGGQRKLNRVNVLQPDGTKSRQEGGFALYRKHCLHCHGVSGAGDGPTSAFLYPRPRDYRKGIFKFTSTVGGQKPTRGDLRKTIREGLHGTSMPAFDALMS
ncbi:MAG: c-type cytochrome, partial [Planctomycetia bacterium]|nr:c-type cytochrome [Planctomycetia bacterium]